MHEFGLKVTCKHVTGTEICASIDIKTKCWRKAAVRSHRAEVTKGCFNAREQTRFICFSPSVQRSRTQEVDW